MSRRVRLEKKGMLYHVICRGQRKEPLFFSKSDMNKYCQIVNFCLTQYDVQILSYCIMRNHVHLLIKRGTLPLADFMHRLNTIYAIYFNNKYALAGHVFQGRYKAFPVLREKYYYSVINYIHDNPKRAGIVEEQSQYAYSSAHIYEGKLLSSPKIKITKYNGEKRLIRNIENRYNYNDYYIGTEKEYKELSKRYRKIETCHYPDRRSEAKIPIGKMLEGICRKKHLNLDDITKKWNRSILTARNEVIYILYMSGYSQTAIGNLFHLSRKTISKIIKRLHK